MALSFKVNAISRIKFFKNVLLSFLFVISFLLIFFSKSDYFVVNKFKSFSNTYIHPITSILVSPIKIVSNLKTQLYEFRNLKSENNILREEIMRLKKLLNATDNSLKLVKTASILSRNDFLFIKMININAGLKDGVIKNMAVVNHRGLLGRTIDTSISSSRVLLLTDPNSSIAVKTISNDNFSILQGADDGIHLISAFNKSEFNPKIGDLVVTSGSAQVFPSDILVGKIVRVKKNKFYVLPFVDFKNIDYVQIVETR